MSIESTQVALFPYRGATGANVPLCAMLDGIRGGKWKSQVKRIRDIGRNGDGFDKAKGKLPAFMLSATTAGGNKAGDVKGHTGLLQIDIDGVGAVEAPDLRDRIGDDRHILAAWVSPSADGVKAIMRIPADVARHKASFEAATDYMRETFAVEIDRACSNLNRLCYVSHDPELVINPQAATLEVSAPAAAGEQREGSTTSLPLPLPLPLHNEPTLHNSVFTEFENLRPIYKRHVTRFSGKPQRGHRNTAMVEIVSHCFCVVAPEFVIAFADEFYHQHIEAYQDYGLERYRQEATALLNECTASYLKRLNETERASFAELPTEQHRTAFRIAQSLSKCESDATLPPPSFALSACELGARMGLRDMEAYRILQSFQKSGTIEIERAGTRRQLGKKGLATVYRWKLER
jgi:hypothetical protein